MERAIRYLQTSFFSARTFTDLANLSAQVFLCLGMSTRIRSVQATSDGG